MKPKSNARSLGRPRSHSTLSTTEASRVDIFTFTGAPAGSEVQQRYGPIDVPHLSALLVVPDESC